MSTELCCGLGARSGGTGSAAGPAPLRPLVPTECGRRQRLLRGGTGPEGPRGFGRGGFGSGGCSLRAPSWCLWCLGAVVSAHRAVRGPLFHRITEPGRLEGSCGRHPVQPQQDHLEQVTQESPHCSGMSAETEISPALWAACSSALPPSMSSSFSC